MPNIDPSVMRKQREMLNLSMDDLSSRAKVDKATIARIESGRVKRSRKHTFDALCRSLKLEPDQLSGLDPIMVDEKSQSPQLAPSQFNTRISNISRNSITLVAKRYRVSAAQIVELAPLLFHIFSSESLQQRSNNLDELDSAWSAVAELGKKFPHITERLVNDWNAEDFEGLERKSIAESDLFGAVLDDGDNFSDTRPLKYGHEEQNPFVKFLQERLRLARPYTGESDRFDGWSGRSAPQFAICRNEAVAFFGGDEEAAQALLDGSCAINEIPKELLGEATDPAGRARWVREKAEARAAEAEAFWASLNLIIEESTK